MREDRMLFNREERISIKWIGKNGSCLLIIRISVVKLAAVAIYYNASLIVKNAAVFLKL